MSIDKTLKKSEMDERTTYLLCPDRDCALFDHEDNPLYRCRRDCPRKEELVQIYQCGGCKEPVELPIDYSGFRATDSHICPDGRQLINRSRDSPSVKIYERPK